MRKSLLTFGLKAPTWLWFVFLYLVPLALSVYIALVATSTGASYEKYYRYTYIVATYQVLLQLAWRTMVATTFRFDGGRQYTLFIITASAVTIGTIIAGILAFRFANAPIHNPLMSSVAFSIPVILICYLYCTYFAIRQLKQTELSRKVGFRDMSSEIGLVLVFTIGIWFLHPRVKALANKLGNNATM